MNRKWVFGWVFVLCLGASQLFEVLTAKRSVPDKWSVCLGVEEAKDEEGLHIGVELKVLEDDVCGTRKVTVFVSREFLRALERVRRGEPVVLTSYSGPRNSS